MSEALACNDPSVDFRTAAFLHTRTRVRERYGFEIDRRLWDSWAIAVQARKGTTFLCARTGGGELWHMKHGQHDMFLVIRRGVVITALGNEEGQFNYLLESKSTRRAMRPVHRRGWDTVRALRDGLQAV